MADNIKISDLPAYQANNASNALIVATIDGVTYTIKPEQLPFIVGPKGEKGETGAGINIRGVVADETQLPTNAIEGDAYIVDQNLFIFLDLMWKDVGQIRGEKGDQGPKGDPGAGFPAGGTTGSILTKSSNTNYDTTWVPDNNIKSNVDSQTITGSLTVSNTISIGTTTLTSNSFGNLKIYANGDIGIANTTLSSELTRINNKTLPAGGNTGFALIKTSTQNDYQATFRQLVISDVANLEQRLTTIESVGLANVSVNTVGNTIVKRTADGSINANNLSIATKVTNFVESGSTNSKYWVNSYTANKAVWTARADIDGTGTNWMEVSRNGTSILGILLNADVTISGNVIFGSANTSLETALSSRLVKSGDTMTGKLTLSSTSDAPLNIPQGTTPSNTSNGDIWLTNNGVYAKINGSTTNMAPILATKSEAESGTTTSVRSWSPQRVKEAIAALAPDMTPLGSVMMLYGDDSVAPDGYLLANGAPVTSAYPNLRAFGIARGWTVDSNGNPLLPDFGGYFPRGWRTGQLVDSGRVFGSVQQDDLKTHSHVPTGKITGGSISNNNGSVRFYSDTVFVSDYGNIPATSSTGGAETRPKNITVTYWIKAFSAGQTTGTADLTQLGNNVNQLLNDVIALKAIPLPVGVNQRWYTASELGGRSVNTSYQNTTGRPIMVAWRTDSSGAAQVSADGTSWKTFTVDSFSTASVIIPPNHSYRISGGGFSVWNELR